MRAAIAGVIALAALAVGATPAGAVGFTTKTLHFDVTIGPAGDQHCDVIADLYKPDSATPSNPAPAILATNGFGGSKDDQASVAKLAASRGYVFLSYSGLGFGGSGCKVTLDDRDYDGKAGSQLVTFLGGGKAATDGTKVNYVKHDATAHDGKHHDADPRVGMIGGSYGGQIQFAVAGIDPRVDTIVPLITWSDLSYSLAPNNTSFDHGVTYGTPGVEKFEWTSLFFGLGIADGIQGTSVDPTRNVGCPNFDNRACGSKVQMDATGAPNDATLTFARHASVESFIKDIHIPTLLGQGQWDTLFNLQEATATYNALRAQHVPVKMIWQLWGHSGGSEGSDGELGYDKPDQNYETRTFMQWFDHYLADRPTKPPLDFTYFRDWISYKGDATPAFAQADAFPIGSRQTLYLSGSNQLVANPAAVVAGSSPFSPPSAGAPSSYTETSALDQDQAVTDAPGTFAQFSSAPLAADEDVIGIPTADVTVSAPTYENAASTGGAPAELVLFFKLYDIKPDGTIHLQRRLIAPVRIADFSHPVHVELPGIVTQFKKGDKIALTIAGGDAAYRGNNTSGPVTISTSTANPGVVTIPVVPASQQHKIAVKALPAELPTASQLAGGLLTVNSTSACAIRKNFKLRIHRRNGLRITSAAIYVNKKRVRMLRGNALKHSFRLTHLPKGKFRLRVVIRGIKHHKRVTIKDSRGYSACKHKRGKKHHHTGK
ncbi:MAG: hypothetical protein QOD53_200 [Thermoleophilaceae bacterium]|nr:hypothetical protein [Thermoleophilaceae bacterium]